MNINKRIECRVPRLVTEEAAKVNYAQSETKCFGSNSIRRECRKQIECKLRNMKYDEHFLAGGERLGAGHPFNGQLSILATNA